MLEEERRLAFVGITRAMRRLHITSAKYRTMRGLVERTIPSRFLEEVGTQHVVLSDQTGVFHGLEDTEWAGGGGRAPAIGREPPRFVPDASAPFPVGTRVRHPQFGRGTVLSITKGSNARAVIRFDDVGTKTLVLEYARLEIVK
jgi:DNA helicase-2/ATP-dependent DNA helicase PcrA